MGAKKQAHFLVTSPFLAGFIPLGSCGRCAGKGTLSVITYMFACVCVSVCLSVSACMSVCLCVHTHTVCLGTGEGFCFAPSLLVRNIAVMAGNTWRRSTAAIRPTLGRLSRAASAGASRLFCQDSSCQAIQTICSHQQEHPRPKPCRSKAS